MVQVLLATVSWVPALLGLGTLLRYGGDPAYRRAVTGLLGVFVLAVAGMLLHLAVALGPAVSAGLWLAGVALFVGRRAWLAEGFGAVEGLGAALALGLAVRWMPSPREAYDSGLYYLQTVQWTTGRPLQLGLALLHIRFGFDSAWHVACAAMELPGLAGRSFLFANLVPLVFVSGAASVGLARLAARAASFGDVAFALGLAVVWQVVGSLGSTTPDVVAALVTYAALVLWARALEADDTGFPGEAGAALLLSTLAVLVKLSAAPVGLAVVAALAWRRRAAAHRRLLAAGAAAAAAGVLWVGRSMLLSGCALFPAAPTCVPDLPWAVPLEAVRDVARAVAIWARTGALGQDEAWLGAWAARNAGRPDVSLLGFTIAAGAAAWGLLARRASAALVIPLAAALAGIVYVALAAPAPRFAWGFLHAAGLLPAAAGIATLQQGRLRRAGVAAAAALLALGAYVAREQHERSGWELRALELPSVPRPALEERVTASGLRVRVPTRTVVGGGDQCWAADAPCTPANQFREDLVEIGRSFQLQARRAVATRR